MDKIKVFLQYPWKFPDSPYYKSLVENPPVGIEYLNSDTQKGATVNRNKFFLSNSLKKNIRRFMNLLNFPIPNARKTEVTRNFDLIHCAHCLSLNKGPWVADFEDMWQMWISGKNTKAGKIAVTKLILSENCKKILAWTEFTKKRILEMVPDVERKIEVVYPSIPEKKFKKKESGKIRIIYASRYFWIKGGLIALETLRKIKRKYPGVEIVFISDAPQNIREKYSEIKFSNLMAQDKLFENLKNSDIFFYPSLIDTFGFTLLEAMSFGLPIVSVNHDWGTPSRKEILKNGKHGFLIDFEKDKLEYHKIEKEESSLIDSLAEKLSILIENGTLRRKMAQSCMKEIKTGKFSIKERNKKLRKIYEEALT